MTEINLQPALGEKSVKASTNRNQPSRENPIESTSKLIAFILIGLYGVSLIIIGVVAALKSPPANQPWLELFKSGFLILGGGLTTVIGYYFGSRGVQEAEASAIMARRDAEAAKKEAENEKLKLRELQEKLSPTYDETSLLGPDEPAEI